MFISGSENQDDVLEMLRNDEKIPLLPMKPFDEIITGPISVPILQVIDDLGFPQPTKIQSQAIPILNEQKADLIAQAQSGSGKTVAFLVSMLLHIDKDVHLPQTICLCHTRELTQQTFNVFTKMNEYTKFKGGICINNMEPPPKDAQLLFGAPASFNYNVKEGVIDISHVNLLVIDEADAILEKGCTHYGPTMKLIKTLPEQVQYAFFSDTLPNSVIETVKKLRNDIITIRAKRRKLLPETIKHWYTRVNNEDEAKRCILELIDIFAKGQTFVFARSKDKVKVIYEFLHSNNVTCRPFSSDLTPEQRDENLEAFRNEEFRVFITTDALALGIKIPQIYLVINYQTPIIWKSTFNFSGQPTKKHFPDCDTYGRRARKAGLFGKPGLCFTIVTDQPDEYDLKDFSSVRQLNFRLNFIENDQLKTLPEKIAAENSKNDPPVIEESSVKANLSQLHEYQDRIDKRPNNYTKSDDRHISEKVHLFDKIYSSFSIHKIENISINEEDEKSHVLVETINDGSTSITYKIFDTKKNLFMCKKVLKYKSDQSEIKNTQNALKEFQILHEIDHPNICKAIGLNTSEMIEIFKNGKKEKVPTIALFFEYNQYRLDEILKIEKINNTMKTKIVIEIVHAMNYIHKKGLIHRDLKIENIMLNSIFETKIIGFGLVKINEYVNDQFSFVNESMTKCVGTLAYMSPEMLNEEEYDNKTDVFSFGVVLHFIFIGSLPKQGMKDKLIGKKIKLPPPSASLSQSCIELLEKCFEPSPKDRPSFETILDDLRKMSFKLAPDVDSFILSQKDRQLDAIESLYEFI